MKDYPIDRCFHVWFWPMDAAAGKSWPVKLAALVVYPFWFAVLGIFLLPVFIVSVLMAAWDELG